MALQGTIKDFGLPDIFQLIGIQRKTGILTLLNGEDSVTLKFLEGQVVGADTQSETLEDRLGELLVRTGRITQAQLDASLHVQKNTLQRLGFILVNAGHISEDELVEALRVQSSQIIYRLFRWHEGNYHFDMVEDLEYDQTHFTPLSSETILMEGARMMDEWPIIERRIRSENMVLAKTESARGLQMNVESILEEDIDFNLGGEPEPPAGEKSGAGNAPISLSPEEHEILALVDGKRTVRAICDLVPLGEFDTYRILSDMVTRNLVEEVRTTPYAGPDSRWSSLPSQLLAWTLLAVFGSLAAFGVASLQANPFTPWGVLATDATSDELRRYASMARLELLEGAVQVFYLDKGTLPGSLAGLAHNGYVEPRLLMDPWGRPYEFHLTSEGYQLSGLDAQGEPHPGLTISRRFNSVQRMMAGGETESP